MRSETQVAVTAVQRGLEVARSRAGADQIERKASALDLVTAAEKAVEKSIRATLAATHFGIVGEEQGGEATGTYWLVDPICGTRNYASGLPLWCVNVALVENGTVTAAVVGDPSTDEIHVAESGTGAWAITAGGERRLMVTDETQTIVIEDSHADRDPARRERAARAVAGAMTASRWEIRALSTSLALPYVAAGRVAGYVLFWTTALHVAAGALLAAEAGATVSDIDGNPWTIDSDSIVATSTPALHADLLAISGAPG
jgi:myo-inositol-1(or 4)-monophosphatase